MKDALNIERGRCEHEECSSSNTECPEFTVQGNQLFKCLYCDHVARYHTKVLEKDPLHPTGRPKLSTEINSVEFTNEDDIEITVGPILYGTPNIGNTMSHDSHQSTAEMCYRSEDNPKHRMTSLESDQPPKKFRNELSAHIPSTSGLTTGSDPMSHSTTTTGLDPSISHSTSTTGSGPSISHSTTTTGSDPSISHSTTTTGPDCVIQSITTGATKVQNYLLCPVCDYTNVNFKVFRSHVRRIHPRAEMKARCSKCLQCYAHILSFKEHCCPGRPPTCITTASELIELSNICTEVADPSLHENIGSPAADVQNLAFDETEDISDKNMELEKDIIVKLCLQLEGLHSVSHIAINEVLKSFTDILKLCDIMTPERESFYNSMSTNFKRKAHYKSIKIFVPPVRVNFDQNETGFIIPLPQLLQTLGKNSSYIEYFKNPVSNQSDDIFKDTTQSSGFINHPGKLLHQTNNIAISLYSDEVELANPIGCKKGLHKLTLLYCTFLNVPIEHRSKLHHVHLIGAIKSSIFKVPEKRSKFLSSFVAEINDLQVNGIMINGEKFFAYLFAYMGDSLAVHQMLGFKESFGPNIKHPCRSCKIEYKEIPFKASVDLCSLRSTAEHQSNLELLEKLRLENKVKQRLELSKELGVNGVSPLFTVNNFSIFQNVFYDPLHVLWEGLVRKQITQVLKSLCDKKVITLESLNDQLAHFKFHKSIISTKYPRPFGSDFKITSSASALHTLFVHLPIFLKDVNSNDEHKQSLFTLLNICKIIMAPNITYDAIMQLQQLVELNHHNLYKLYKDGGFIPKHHMLLHLVQQLYEYGPGRWLSTIRFESNHFIAKRKRFFNFKNLAYSVSNVFQVNQAYTLYEDNLEMLNADLDYALHKIVDSSTDEYLKNLCNGILHQLKYLKVHGTNYTIGDIVISDECNENPVFAVIKGLYHNENKQALLLCQSTHSFYSENLCAYELLLLQDYKLVNVAELCHYNPMPWYHLEGKLIVIVTDGRHIGHLNF